MKLHALQCSKARLEVPMTKRQNTSPFTFAIILSVLCVTLGWAAPNSLAQHSFRANIVPPENENDSLEKNTQTTKTLTDRNNLPGEDPNKTYPADANPLIDKTIPSNPLGTDPVKTINSSDDKADSASEDGADDNKDSQNASQMAAKEKDISAEIFSPWENRVLGQPYEKTDARQMKEQNQSPLPSPWKTLVSLLIVLALIVGVTYFFKRFCLNSNRKSLPAGVEILARSSMNPKQSLCLVQLGNRLVLLGQSPNHISSLQSIDDPDEIAQILGQLERKKTLSITNTFGKLFHREKELYENDQIPAMSLDIEDDQDQNQPTQPWCQAKGELSSLLDKVKGLSKIRFRS
jgi:flagellar biogenesis protein FliO